MSDEEMAPRTYPYSPISYLGHHAVVIGNSIIAGRCEDLVVRVWEGTPVDAVGLIACKFPFCKPPEADGFPHIAALTLPQLVEFFASGGDCPHVVDQVIVGTVRNLMGATFGSWDLSVYAGDFDYATSNWN